MVEKMSAAKVDRDLLRREIQDRSTVGWPPLRELFAKAMECGVLVHV